MASPKRNDVVHIDVWIVECGEGAGEVRRLLSCEPSRVSAQSAAQFVLDEKAGAQISDVVDGFIEPSVRRPSPSCRRRECVAPTVRIASVAVDQSARLKGVDAPVGEWSAERPDTSEWAVGREFSDELPPVRRLCLWRVDHETQADAVCEWKVLVHAKSVDRSVQIVSM